MSVLKCGKVLISFGCALPTAKIAQFHYNTMLDGFPLTPKAMHTKEKMKINLHDKCWDDSEGWVKEDAE